MRIVACLAVLAVGMTTLQAQEAPGLVAEYFDMPGIKDFPNIPAGKKPTFVRVEKQVNYSSTNGDFAGTKLTESYYVRWTGILRVKKAGSYTFFTTSDDGSRLSIDGKVVVNNPGIHPMIEKSGKVDLQAGDREIKIEFVEVSGGAGCIASWQPPGGSKEAISAKALFHKKADEKIAWDKKAWKKRRGGGGGGGRPRAGSGKYSLTNYGPYYSGCVDSLFGGRGNYSYKGRAIGLDKDRQAAVCFDTELLRYSGGWVDGFVGYPAGRDGIEGQPFAAGEVRWGTGKGSLGWAKGSSFDDPRGTPYGPLPRDWARYKGLYLHGDKVILSYSVGKASVLEMPGFTVSGKLDIFDRTIRIDGASSPLKMLVCEDSSKTGRMDGAVAVLDGEEQVTAVAVAVAVAGAGAKLAIAGGSRVELSVPAGRCRVYVWSGAKEDLAGFTAFAKSAPAATDIGRYVKGGPARWTEPVVTKGVLGRDPGPYTVDTLTVPYDNPYKSYMRLTGVDFFSDGRAAVSTMDGDVWVVSGIDESLSNLKWKRYATGLFQSLGLKVLDDKIHTLGRDQITRLHDLNDDGEADFYECVNNDCQVSENYHEFALDLQVDSKGNFYYCKGSPWPPRVKTDHQGCLLKVSADGSKLEVYATGLRAPNGMGMGPNDEVTFGDNQGHWMPACRLNLVEKGGFYGMMQAAHRNPAPKTYDNPICWLPMNIDNSNGGQVWVEGGKWGPLEGRMLYMTYGKCWLFNVLLERFDDGEVQGGVVKFPLQFLSGIMRGRFNKKDGQLYVVGMKGWQTAAPREGCLQRVRYTGKPVVRPVSAKVLKGGMAITFTAPLDKETAADPDSWSAEGSNLHWTGNYGSAHYMLSDPKKKGKEALEITGAKLSADGKTVTLAIPKMQPMFCLAIKYRIRSAAGATVLNEINYTVNRVPK